MTEKLLPSANYLLVMGILLLIFGCIAIAAPAVAGAWVVIVLGAILVVSGVVQMVQGFREPAWSSKLTSLVLGAITLLGGLAVLAHPWLGLTVLAFILAVYFVVEGVWKIVTSFSFRPASGWLAILASGILGLVLGIIIWQQWPLSSLWIVGILVGVDLMFTGAAMLTLAVTVRRLKKTMEA